MEHQDTKLTSMRPRLKELNDNPYLTYLGEVIYHLSKIRSRLKEKHMDSYVVGLGLSLDVLYI